MKNAVALIIVITFATAANVALADSKTGGSNGGFDGKDVVCTTDANGMVVCK